MHELSLDQAESVGGGMTAIEGAGMILGLAAFAASSPIVMGVAFGAAAGLIIADHLARSGY